MKSVFYQKLLVQKIEKEYEDYKKEILSKHPIEIFNKAWQIDTIRCIYEILMEDRRTMPKAYVRFLVLKPNILGYFYKRWMEVPDLEGEQLRKCMMSVLRLEGQAG